MVGYQTRLLDISVGKINLKLKALKDRDQYFDPHKLAKKAGITEAYWSFFGQLWPAGLALANSVKTLNFNNKRVLELGCGLGLPSLILKKKGIDITASDRHPLSEQFLDFNSDLNHLSEIPFIDLNWEEPDLSIGKFDAIIASDVLYEEQHINQLSKLINKLAKPEAEVYITCPGRGFRNKFSRKMVKKGFEYDAQPIPFDLTEEAPYKGRLLSFQRH